MYKWIPWVSLGLVVVILLSAFLSQGSLSVGTSDGKGGLATGGMGGDVAPEAPRDDMPIYEDYYQPSPDGDQFIIRTGYLTIKVQHAGETVNALEDVAEKYGGDITNRSLSEFEGLISGYVTLTVEESQFETAIDEIKALALVVENESVSADDVTETVIDIETRLGTARAEETRYLQILNQAQTVEEILLVEEQLARVRTVIESYEAQLEYYQQKTAYSTITVSLTEETTVEFGGVEFRPGQEIINAAQTVVELAQQLVVGLIYLVVVGGAVAIPLLVIYAIARAIKAGKS